MVVEVSHTTLFTDTTTKAEWYATAGVPDYWVIDVENRKLLVFRDPVPLAAGLGATAYQTRQTLAALGEDNVMFETDFPHPTCLYPSVREQVQASLADLPARVQRKVLHENAARVYGLTLPH